MFVIRLAASLLFLASCGGKSASKIADEHRAVAEPIIAQLKALAPIAKDAPQLTDTAWQLPPGIKVDFDMTVPNQANANAGVVTVGTLAEPCNGDLMIKWDDGKEVYFPLDHTESWLRNPACLLATGKGRLGVEDLDADSVERQFKLLESVKYVLVVRPKTMLRPMVKNDREFSMGMISGDVHLYELATKKDLGGFAFAVSSKDKVEVVGSRHNDQVTEELTKDTRFHLAEQLGKTKQIKAWP